jgi:uncharacterized membrane protein YqaE (UPF0057 family)
MPSSTSDICLYALAVFLPPVSVFLKTGFNSDFKTGFNSGFLK